MLLIPEFGDNTVILITWWQYQLLWCVENSNKDNIKLFKCNRHNILQVWFLKFCNGNGDAFKENIVLNFASYIVLIWYDLLSQYPLGPETHSPPAVCFLKKFSLNLLNLLLEEFFPCLMVSFHQHLNIFKSFILK